MANYIELTTGIVKSEQQIRSENPQTSYPASFPCPEGYAVVFPAPAPSHDTVTKTAREIAPVLTAKGHYEQAWEVVPLDAATIAANQAKAIEQLQAAIVIATQSRLDEFAKTRGYDGILSAATYASSTVPKFAQEGQDAVNLRDSTWAALYAILAEVTAGARPMPTGFADIETSLPVLAWSV